MTQNTPRGSIRKVLLYGDVNMNILDGSAVWLVSMAEALSRTDSEVSVLLKAPVTNPRLLGRIMDNPRIEIIPPTGSDEIKGFSARQAAQEMARLDSEHPFDVVIARGTEVSSHVANSEALAHKSWLYITDIQHPSTHLSVDNREKLGKIIGRCHRFFVQTESARSYIEATIPEAAGKTLVLTPMIPDEYFDFAHGKSHSAGEVRAVYSGKFAKNWRTLEMCSLPAEAAVKGLNLSLTMIGDKFQNDAQDGQWAARMRKAIDFPGVEWLGGLSRDGAVEEVRRHDIGLSWRDASMDGSLELSTKVLEYAALGVPPVVNRNAQYVELFGPDYPLYVDEDSTDAVVNLLRSSRRDLTDLGVAVRDRVRQYSISASADRLRAYFERSEADYDLSPRSRHKTRVLIAGHDLKFAGELVAVLNMREDVELAFDHWETLHTHDESASERLRDWADVIICEWCGPNAVWYSNNKRPRQKLIVRLHMFELNGPWLASVAKDNIDVLVCVSQLYVERTLKRTQWNDVNVVVIPNAVDVADLARQKEPGHRFRLGIVGIVPMRKRLDRSIDLLERLLAHDNRYTLHVRGRMPWEYPYEWKKPLQREAYLEIFARIGRSEALREAVVFEPFGPDMASWLRKIGYVLSPSSDESFHLAPAEGMASGAVPVFWERPGVNEIFSSRWTHSSTSEAFRFVSELNESTELYTAESAAARAHVQHFDMRQAGAQWLQLIAN
ncbi:glycosyltransferase [Arthrobacter sp. Hor0625]|uniref:glycosyltransferase n=1 Tax=Arthrobacter sp. Hor0625 TaxID=3457358 RepID=UPI00403E60EA